MTRGRRLLAAVAQAAVVVAAAAAPARAATLTPTWTHAVTQGIVDGITLGDINADGRDEIAITVRGGTYAPGIAVPATGAIALVDANDTLLWQKTFGVEILGYPVAADFDGDGFDEFAFCEHGSAAPCVVLDGDGSTLFTTKPFWFPAMTNGGPSAADVNGDGFADLIVASFGGEVAVELGPMGTEAWRQDIWNLNKDLIFGHTAIADVNGDGTLDIVVGGWYAGGLYMFNAKTGAVEMMVPAVGALAANPTPGNLVHFQSSGPLLTQLDADPAKEIVGMMVGTSVTAVVAFKANGTVKWWRELPATDYFGFASPVAADLDGDGIAEIFVQSLGGIAYELNGANGQIIATRNVGAGSWATPAMFDATLDGKPDLLFSSLSSFQLVDVAGGGTLLDSYTEAGAQGFFPPPVAADIDGDGKVEILAGTWQPRQVHKFDLPDPLAYKWTQYMGGPAHTGSIDTNSPQEFLGVDPSLTANLIYTQINAMIPGAPARAQNSLRNAATQVLNAWRQYMRGNPHLANQALARAMSQLQTAAARGANTTQQQQYVAYLAIMIFRQYLDRTRSLVPNGTPAITQGDTTLAAAQAAYAAGNWANAVAQASNGTTALRNWLDTAFNWQALINNCPTAPTHVYHENECMLLQALDAIKALEVLYPGNGNLNNAEISLKNGIAWFPDIVLANVFPSVINADTSLAAVAPPPTVAAIRQTMAKAMMQSARKYIDNVIVFRGTADPNVQAAEALYSQGVAAYNAGAYATALVRFRDAQADAALAV